MSQSVTLEEPIELSIADVKPGELRTPSLHKFVWDFKAMVEIKVFSALYFVLFLTQN